MSGELLQLSAYHWCALCGQMRRDGHLVHKGRKALTPAPKGPGPRTPRRAPWALEPLPAA